MSSSSTPSSPDPQPHPSSLENRLSSFLEKQGKSLLYGLALTLFILSLAFRWGSSQQVEQERDYLQAALQFEQLFNGTTDPTAPVQKLQATFSSHPNLRPRYEGAIAHSLIRDGAPDQGKQWATQTLQRIAPLQHPLMQQFSATTLTLLQGDHAAAFEEAEALEQALFQSPQPQTLSTLFTANLLRKGFLAYQQGWKEKELQAWEQLTALQKGSLPFSATAANTLLKSFQDGSTGLQLWIQSRQKAQ